MSLPPATLATGTANLFLSDTVRAHRKLREAGVEADLQVYEGLSHASYTCDPIAPVTKQGFGEIGRFFGTRLTKRISMIRRTTPGLFVPLARLDKERRDLPLGERPPCFIQPVQESLAETLRHSPARAEEQQ
jgi:hypothetical protein